MINVLENVLFLGQREAAFGYLISYMEYLPGRGEGRGLQILNTRGGGEGDRGQQEGWKGGKFPSSPGLASPTPKSLPSTCFWRHLNRASCSTDTPCAPPGRSKTKPHCPEPRPEGAAARPGAGWGRLASTTICGRPPPPSPPLAVIGLRTRRLGSGGGGRGCSNPRSTLARTKLPSSGQESAIAHGSAPPAPGRAGSRADPDPGSRRSFRPAGLGRRAAGL